MSKRILNKKSLLQMGGDSNIENPMDPGSQIINYVKERLNAGEEPQAVVMSLIQQNVPQEAISGILEQVGYAPADVVALFQSLQTAGQEQPEMQYGGSSEGYLHDHFNPNIPKPNYLPLIPEQGNALGAVAALDDAAGALFSGEVDDKTGLMTGAARDMKAKKARWRERNPEYYKYTIEPEKLDPSLLDEKQTPIEPQKKGPSFRDFMKKLEGEQSFTIHNYGADPNLPSIIPSRKEGGQLPKAQTGGPMPFDEWANMSGRGAAGMEYQDQMDYEKYKKSFEVGAVQNPDGPVMPQAVDPSYGGYQKTIDDISGVDENGLPQMPNEADPKYGVKVTKNTNFTSWMKNQLDRPEVDLYGKAATAGVGVANVANEMFKQGRFNSYEDKLRQSTMADKVFATTKNPINSRGMWDVNTGLAEPDNYVPYLQAAQYGGAQESEELDVDNETLMKLIAAGADIQIL